MPQRVATSKNPPRPIMVLHKQRSVSSPAPAQFPCNRLLANRSGYVMFWPIFSIPVRTGFTTTYRYPLENGLTTELINPLLNPQIARLNGSMGSLKPEGRTMESPAGACETWYG